MTEYVYIVLSFVCLCLLSCIVCRDGAQMYYGYSYGPAPGETYRGSVYCGYGYLNLSNCVFGAETTSCDPQDALGISCNTSLYHVPIVSQAEIASMK